MPSSVRGEILNVKRLGRFGGQDEAREPAVGLPWQRLREDISKVGRRGHIVQAERFRRNVIPNEVVPHVDVLAAVVVHCVARQVPAALIVVVEA